VATILIMFPIINCSHFISMLWRRFLATWSDFRPSFVLRPRSTRFLCSRTPWIFTRNTRPLRHAELLFINSCAFNVGLPWAVKKYEVNDSFCALHQTAIEQLWIHMLRECERCMSTQSVIIANHRSQRRHKQVCKGYSCMLRLYQSTLLSRQLDMIRATRQLDMTKATSPPNFADHGGLR